MLVRVDNIKDSGLPLEFSEPVAAFPGLVELQDQGECTFAEAVHLTGRAQRIAGLIEIDGEIRTAATLQCSRCLNDYTIPLVVSFSVTFSAEAPVVTDEEDGAELELSAEELGLVPFSGDELDLREVVQEQVIMALPLRPLCREECRGLCPWCGTDLNRGSCQCEAPIFNDRFGKLRDLKKDLD